MNSDHTSVKRNKCNFCSYETNVKEELEDHMNQEVYKIFSNLVKSQSLICDKIDKLQRDLSESLGKVTDDNLVIKQELFILKQNQIVESVHKQTKESSDKVNMGSSQPKARKNQIPELTDTYKIKVVQLHE